MLSKLFLFFIIHQSIFSQLITIPYTTRIVTKQIEIPIRYKTKPVSLNIDLTMPFTWTCVANTDMTDLWDKPTYNITVENQKSSAYNLTYDLFFKRDGQELQDKININLYLIDIKSRLDLPIGAWGFGLQMKEEKYSFMQQLKNNGIIEHRKFGFEATNNREGFFHIGGMPDRITKEKHLTKCKVEERYSKSNWGCLLREISFVDDSGSKLVYPGINRKTVSYFQTYSNSMQVPLSFMNYLKDNVLKQHFNANKDCDYFVGFDLDYIKCKCDIKLPSINFVFGENRYTLSLNDMSNRFYTDLYCNLDFITFREESNEFVFENAFLDKFNLEFDYDEKTINFYTDYKPEFIGNFLDAISLSLNVNKNYLLSGIIVIGLLIEVIGCLAILRYLTGKKEKYQPKKNKSIIDDLLSSQIV